ncbi:hypothetical protein D9M68_46880 [compost metagenome]
MCPRFETCLISIRVSSGATTTQKRELEVNRKENSFVNWGTSLLLTPVSQRPFMDGGGSAVKPICEDLHYALSLEVASVGSWQLVSVVSMIVGGFRHQYGDLLAQVLSGCSAARNN